MIGKVAGRVPRVALLLTLPAFDLPSSLIPGERALLSNCATTRCQKGVHGMLGPPV